MLCKNKHCFDLLYLLSEVFTMLFVYPRCCFLIFYFSIISITFFMLFLSSFSRCFYLLKMNFVILLHMQSLIDYIMMIKYVKVNL